MNFVKAGAVFMISFVTLIFAVYGYLMIDLPDVRSLKSENPRTTAFLEQQMTSSEKPARLHSFQNNWITIDQIPEILQKTVIVSEDASFWIHEGIDWYEIRQSLAKNMSRGKVARGGSTITQQLAKNLYLSPKKSIYRKVKEYLIARELEKHLSKKRILEIYLNVIEFGNGVFGIGPASRHYFNKKPWQLSLDETVRLIAVLPNPHGMNPNRLNRQLRWRCKIIVRRLHRFHYISDSMFEVMLRKYDAVSN